MKKLVTVAITICLVVVSYSAQSTKVTEHSAMTLLTLATTTVPVATTVPPTTTSVVATTTSTTTAPPVTLLQPESNIILVSMETPQVSDLERLICFVGSEWDCGEAIAVSQCESWHTPHSISPFNSNGTRDWGLFQINDVWADAFPRRWEHRLDPVTNIEMAHHIWLVTGRSWKHWTCQP